MKSGGWRPSAAIPRIYRIKIQRDIYKDLRSLEKSVMANDEDNSGLDLLSLEMFENIAYVMAKHANLEVPGTPEEWLDGFNTFSINQILPQITDLWGLNVQTESESKKLRPTERKMTTVLFLSLCTARLVDTGP